MKDASIKQLYKISTTLKIPMYKLKQSYLTVTEADEIIRKAISSYSEKSIWDLRRKTMYFLEAGER